MHDEYCWTSHCVQLLILYIYLAEISEYVSISVKTDLLQYKKYIP